MSGKRLNPFQKKEFPQVEPFNQFDDDDQLTSAIFQQLGMKHPTTMTNPTNNSISHFHLRSSTGKSKYQVIDNEDTLFRTNNTNLHSNSRKNAELDPFNLITQNFVGVDANSPPIHHKSQSQQPTIPTPTITKSPIHQQNLSIPPQHIHPSHNIDIPPLGDNGEFEDNPSSNSGLEDAEQQISDLINNSEGVTAREYLSSLITQNQTDRKNFLQPLPFSKMPLDFSIPTVTELYSNTAFDWLRCVMENNKRNIAADFAKLTNVLLSRSPSQRGGMYGPAVGSLSNPTDIITQPWFPRLVKSTIEESLSYTRQPMIDYNSYQFHHTTHISKNNSNSGHISNPKSIVSYVKSKEYDYMMVYCTICNQNYPKLCPYCTAQQQAQRNGTIFQQNDYHYHHNYMTNGQYPLHNATFNTQGDGCMCSTMSAKFHEHFMSKDWAKNNNHNFNSLHNGGNNARDLVALRKGMSPFSPIGSNNHMINHNNDHNQSRQQLPQTYAQMLHQSQQLAALWSFYTQTYVFPAHRAVNPLQQQLVNQPDLNINFSANSDYCTQWRYALQSLWLNLITPTPQNHILPPNQLNITHNAPLFTSFYIIVPCQLTGFLKPTLMLFLRMSCLDAIASTDFNDLLNKFQSKKKKSSNSSQFDHNGDMDGSQHSLFTQRGGGMKGLQRNPSRRISAGAGGYSQDPYHHDTQSSQNNFSQYPSTQGSTGFMSELEFLQKHQLSQHDCDCTICVQCYITTPTHQLLQRLSDADIPIYPITSSKHMNTFQQQHLTSIGGLHDPNDANKTHFSSPLDRSGIALDGNMQFNDFPSSTQSSASSQSSIIDHKCVSDSKKGHNTSTDQHIFSTHLLSEPFSHGSNVLPLPLAGNATLCGSLDRGATNGGSLQATTIDRARLERYLNTFQDSINKSRTTNSIINGNTRTNTNKRQRTNAIIQQNSPHRPYPPPPIPPSIASQPVLTKNSRGKKTNTGDIDQSTTSTTTSKKRKQVPRSSKDTDNDDNIHECNQINGNDDDTIEIGDFELELLQTLICDQNNATSSAPPPTPVSSSPALSIVIGQLRCTSLIQWLSITYGYQQSSIFHIINNNNTVSGLLQSGAQDQPGSSGVQLDGPHGPVQGSNSVNVTNAMPDEVNVQSQYADSLPILISQNVFSYSALSTIDISFLDPIQYTVPVVNKESVNDSPSTVMTPKYGQLQQHRVLLRGWFLPVVSTSILTLALFQQKMILKYNVLKRLRSSGAFNSIALVNQYTITTISRTTSQHKQEQAPVQNQRALFPGKNIHNPPVKIIKTTTTVFNTHLFNTLYAFFLSQNSTPSLIMFPTKLYSKTVTYRNEGTSHSKTTTSYGLTHGAKTSAEAAETTSDIVNNNDRANYKLIDLINDDNATSHGIYLKHTQQLVTYLLYLTTLLFPSHYYRNNEKSAQNGELCEVDKSNDDNNNKMSQYLKNNCSIDLFDASDDDHHDDNHHHHQHHNTNHWNLQIPTHNKTSSKLSRLDNKKCNSSSTTNQSTEKGHLTTTLQIECQSKPKVNIPFGSVPLSVFIHNNVISLSLQLQHNTKKDRTLEVGQDEKTPSKYDMIESDDDPLQSDNDSDEHKYTEGDHNNRTKTVMKGTNIEFNMSSSLLNWKTPYYNKPDIYYQSTLTGENNEGGNNNKNTNHKHIESLQQQTQRPSILHSVTQTRTKNSVSTVMTTQDISPDLVDIERTLFMLLQQQLCLKTLTTRQYDDLFLNAYLEVDKYTHCVKIEQYREGNAKKVKNPPSPNKNRKRSSRDGTRPRGRLQPISHFDSINSQSSLMGDREQSKQVDGRKIGKGTFKGIQTKLQMSEKIKRMLRREMFATRLGQQNIKTSPQRDTLFWVQLAKSHE